MIYDTIVLTLIKVIKNMYLVSIINLIFRGQNCEIEFRILRILIKRNIFSSMSKITIVKRVQLQF